MDAIQLVTTPRSIKSQDCVCFGYCISISFTTTVVYIYIFLKYIYLHWQHGRKFDYCFEIDRLIFDFRVG